MAERNLEQELRSVLSQALTPAQNQGARADLTTVNLDDDLVRALGLDSLAALRLLAAVEKRFQVRFPDEKLSQLRTLRLLLEAIANP